MSEKLKSYKDLIVWQKSITLVKLVYRLTGSFPSEEKFGLVSQMRRAAVSVPSNISEGHARNTTGEFIQFISHAEGSLAELETQLIISTELGFCTDEQTGEIRQLVQEIQKMAHALRRSLASRPYARHQIRLSPTRQEPRLYRRSRADPRHLPWGEPCNLLRDRFSPGAAAALCEAR